MSIRAVAAAQQPSEVALQPVGISLQVIRFACLAACELDDEVVAYVQGIRIGGCHVRGRFSPGQIVELPVSYLPWVDLPTEIRFALARDGSEVSPPLPLTRYDEAVALVGLGEITVDSLTIEQGMARGSATNRVNGLLRPQMFARINGLVPRTVDVDHPRLLEDGGASYQFAVQLFPADLGDNGLSIDIFTVGSQIPLASVAYRRADTDDLTRRILALETRLQQAEQASGFQIATLSGDLNARIGLLQKRMDAFIECSASFLFDRQADVRTTFTGADLPPADRKTVQAFLSFVHGGAEDGEAGEEAAAPQGVRALPLRSPHLSFGWYDVESDNGHDFRWMGASGIVFNPEPNRPVAEVVVAIRSVYGAREPMLKCQFDTRDAVLTAERSRPGEPLRCRIALPDGAPGQVQALRLESLVSASPARAEGHQDDRILSIAISEIAFVYAG